MIELLLLLVVGSIGCSLVLLRLGFDRSAALMTGCAAGPVLFALLPLELDGVLPVRVSVALLTLACTGCALWPQPKSDDGSSRTAAGAQDRGGFVPLAIIAGLGVSILIVLPWVGPLIAHDPTEYALLAARIAESGGAAPYPVVPADPETGFYFPSSHPRGYAALLAAGIDPAVGIADVPMRVVTAWYLALFLFGLVLMVPAGVARALVLILGTSVPLFAIQVADLSIDPIRLSLTVAAMVAACELLRRTSWPMAVGCGIVFGGLASIHSSSIATLGLLTLGIMVIHRETVIRRVGIAAAVVAVMLLFGGWQYLDNLLERGSPVSDSVAVWEIEELGEVDDLRIRRGLDGGIDRIVASISPFVVFPMFGLLWLVAVPGIWRALRSGASIEARVSLVLLVGFVGAMVLSMIVGVDLLIKNPRYAMSTLPAAAILATGGLLIVPAAWRVLVSGVVFSVMVSAMAVGMSGRVSIPTVVDPTSNDWLAFGDLQDQEFAFLREFPGEEGSRTMVTTQGSWARWVGTPMVSHIDSSVLPAYLAETPEEALEILQDLDVDRIHYSSYFPACWSNSPLFEVLMSPERSTPIETGVQTPGMVLEIHETPRPVVYRSVESASFPVTRLRGGVAAWLLRGGTALRPYRFPDPERLGYRFRIRFPVRDSYRVYIRDPKGIRFVWDGISRSAGDELEVFARSQFPLESVSIVVECEDRDALPEVFEVEEAMAGPGGRG